MASILIAEDDEGVRSFLVEALEMAGHRIKAVEDGNLAIDFLRETKVDLVLTDVRMPGADGIAVTRFARALTYPPAVILLTAHGAIESAVEAMRLGAFNYLQKPLPSPSFLRQNVRDALIASRDISNSSSVLVSPDNSVKNDTLPEFQLSWGAPTMLPVIDALRRVAKTNASVMLEGETGCGKEIFAHTLHQQSNRSKFPFVAINCASLSDSLMESELFGHEKGSFTGAHAQRIGQLEEADGGTFFLDEIGELALPLQAKLLRVIETRCYTRVGGTKKLSADVRWVTATHRDLRQMVKEGRFRQDLYHRLAVFPIKIPALRERREDIPELSNLLLDQIAKSARLPTPVISQRAYDLLKVASWTGNVRELRNTLERALILADGNSIEPEHLNLSNGASEDMGGRELPSPANGTSPEVGALEMIERQAIVDALKIENGNRRATALRLGIGLRTLYDKLKRYQI
ncbi:sigma-54-dependent Fis family transcriptional regulator [Undibacterium sp. LX40W]|uniref:Sigma-54-dependent Fis family transcriptional regulator n=1 Tax=Undibacterium nitidum TaxID=2762298 RepID=A0A923HQ33_9BURK|nr:MULTISPECIES: sigma-54 dependent transcriptional regulator [Undibacterium]MBC3881195.1 sigma-54-dependent Fis family transcriptional regulator [Undibacterium nitidum]MBC3890072.1 sigma-54-dependent Fis family transcriptional regulator [Undibacterium sp. LX40W]